MTAGRYPERMANTSSDWLAQPPRGIKVVAYQRDCGWHVIVSATGPSVESQLRPRIMGKACVPLYIDADKTRVVDQLRAIVIGVDAIMNEQTETCNRL